MSAPALKLVAHFGESTRADGRLLSDALMDLVAETRVAASALLRGIEGFGLTHALRTDRLLTLSEDLPLVVIAVDRPSVIAPLAAEAGRMLSGGLLTLERAALGGPGGAEAVSLLGPSGRGRLTVYCGRGEARAGRPAPEAAVAAMRAAGLPGAIVLTGLDGTIGGERRRARVLSRNAGVPALVQCVGPAAAIAAVLPELGGIAGTHVATLERVRIVRRDGVRVEPPPRVPDRDPSGMGLWQRVTVTCGEDARLDGHPLHVQLIRRLRAAGASGATVLRGTWGYSGQGPLHHDRLLALRRRTPVVVSIVERPEGVARLWPIVDEATAGTGLVACEVLPAARAHPHDGPAVGGLRLASPPG